MRSIRGWTPLTVLGQPKLSIAVATFEQRAELATLLFSFVAQTYPHWEAVVVHDGPGPIARDVVALVNDPRVRLIEAPERRADFGHSWRELGIDACTGDYIGLTNGDNYYAPVYFEWMLHLLTAHAADLAYCDWVHSHTQYSVMRAGPAQRLIDLGCWIGAAGLVRSTPWRDRGFAGDGVYFESLVRNARSAVHLPRPLFVHN